MGRWAALCAALLPGLACGSGAEGTTGGSALPEVLGRVAPFSLVERSGREVGLEDLAGAPWVANLVFTRCSGPCPRLSASFADLQGRLEGTGARLVSISVDPSHDTPQVLREYADHYRADPDRWWFLTGAEEDVHALVTGSLKQAFVADADRPAGMRVTHSTRFVLVDGDGGIRGFYESGEAGAIEALVRRVRRLGGGERS